MASLGELFVWIFYGILALAGLFCLFRLVSAGRGRSRIIYMVGLIACVSIIIIYYQFKKRSHRQIELAYAGTYYLIQYPKCDNCKLLLLEDNTYQVMGNNNVVETGDWRYESGGDYFIVYLDDDNEQLGAGKFAYDTSHNNAK